MKKKMKMNLVTIQTRIKEIEEKRWDDEAAHNLEDALMADFIMFVQENGDETLSTMAKEVLKTSDIPFERWCA